MTHEEILQQKRVCQGIVYACMHILHMYLSNCVLSSMDQMSIYIQVLA